MKQKKYTSAGVLFLFIISMLFQQCTVIRSGQVIVRDPTRIEDHVIPIDSAIFYTTNFKKGVDELKQQLADPGFLDRSFNLPSGELFNRDVIATLLNAPGADGIRIYLGRNDTGAINLVLIPTDKEGNDIITQLMPLERAAGQTNNRQGLTAGGVMQGQAVENGQRCPTICGKNSPLHPENR